MKTILILLLGSFLGCITNATPYKALIIDGQNNHAVWPKSTIMMRQYLEETGLFEVDIARTQFLATSRKHANWLKEAGVAEGTETGPKTDPDFKPDFDQYDVVISNFGFRAAPWPKETQLAFEKYVREGGGFVSIHAANNCFPKWPEYNEMIGIGGWGGRNHKDGPYVYVNELGEVVRDESKGPGGAHGKLEEFQITMREPEHPIAKGLPAKWMQAVDECYCKLRGPAKNLTILGTAVSTITNRHEPQLMAIRYHDGRIFHTTLGHDERGFESVGFIETFQRGTEWAATGEVIDTTIPSDFPTEEKSSSRKFVYKRNPNR